MKTQVLTQTQELAPTGSAQVNIAEGTTYEFREVTEVGEVQRLLALRHTVYAATDATRGYVDPEGPPLLLDAYDLFSQLYGLFHRTAADTRLIGTLRIASLEHG